MGRFSRFWLLAALVAAFAAMTSCKKDETKNDKPGVTQKEWPQVASADDAGGKLQYAFTALGDWTARSSHTSWCRVLTPSGGEGRANLEIEVDPNSTGKDRQASITVAVTGYAPTVFAVKQGKGRAEATGIVKYLDEDLRENYLWNAEYKAMSPDFSIPFKSSSDNFLNNTLMEMTTNTLDKKRQSDGSYHLYSNMSRSGNGTSASSKLTRASIGKEPTLSYGIATATIVTIDKQGNLSFCVSSVYPDSPASRVGIKRGFWITQINGAPITQANYMNYLYQLIMPSSAQTLTLVDSFDGNKTVTVSPTSMYENPVLRADVIEQGGHKIGYLVYKGFEAAYDDDLVAAFADFKARGITDMILDLRLNGGGHVITANLIATCIAGSRAQGKKFTYYRYNDERMADVEATKLATGNDYDPAQKKFFDTYDYDFYANLGKSLSAYALDRQKLYVLVSGSTASASELVINSLKGIDVDVVLIGERTNGKNVGMESWSKTVDGYRYEVLPITFQTYNAKGFGDYSTGFEPDHVVYDYNFSGPEGGTYYFEGFRDFGDSTEPMFAKAVSLITGTQSAALRATRTASTPRGVVVEGPQDTRKPAGMIVIRENTEEE